MCSSRVKSHSSLGLGLLLPGKAQELSRKDVPLRPAETSKAHGSHGHQGGHNHQLGCKYVQVTSFHSRVRRIKLSLLFHGIPLYSYGIPLDCGMISVVISPSENSPGTQGPQGKILSGQPQQPQGPSLTKSQNDVVQLLPLILDNMDMTHPPFAWNYQSSSGLICMYIYICIYIIIYIYIYMYDKSTGLAFMHPTVNEDVENRPHTYVYIIK